MRKLTDHIANPVNDKLEILVLDEPGPGGANHVYEIRNAGDETRLADHRINFQKGAINEAGINGVTQEVLLAVVIDRLRCFQAGPFSSGYNERALQHCVMALDELKSRTRDRMARGVEGRTVA